MQKVITAAKSVNIHNFITSLPMVSVHFQAVKHLEAESWLHKPIFTSTEKQKSVGASGPEL